MPEHRIDDVPGSSIPDYLKDDRFKSSIVCKSSREPGYAHTYPDGRLHCNNCGWTTPEPVVTAYSDSTGHTYLTWDELVEKEANGYVVVGTSDRKGTIPVVVGPFPDKEAARKAQSRLRPKWKREENPHKIHTFVRVLWDPERF